MTMIDQLMRALKLTKYLFTTFAISIHISQHHVRLCGLRIINYILLGIFLIIYFAAHNHLWNLPQEEKD